jgi:hypothetical protein
MIDICASNNNSPSFYSEANALLKCNQPVYYNFVARDYIDNDSLVYELIDPLGGYYGYPAKTNWNSGFSSQTPFTVYCTGSCSPPSPKSFPPKGLFLDKNNGDLIFTPTNCSESTIAAIKVSEYRKDSKGKYQLIGYVVRDHQFIVMNMADNNIPIINGPDKIYFADSTESSFNFSTKDSYVIPTTGSPVLNDTVKIKMFAGPYKLADTTFKVVNPKLKNPSGIFKWKPLGLSNSRPYLLILQATDNACPYTGNSFKSVNVYVRKKSELAWVEGIVFKDLNKNCKRDSFEITFPNAMLSADGGKSLTFITDSSGYFSGWLPADTCNFRVMSQIGSTVCNTTIKLTAGKKYSLEIGNLPNMKISGSVYTDNNKNCKADSSEPKLKNEFVYTDPGEFTSMTDSKGQWKLEVPAGDYKIMHAPKRLFTKVKCPTTPYTVSIFNDTLFQNKDIAIFDSANIIELSVSFITNKFYRKGSNNSSTLTIKNNGSKTISGASVWIRFNKKITYVSSSPSYTVKTDTTLKFSLPTMKTDDEASYDIKLYADPSKCNIGDNIISYAWLDTNGISKDIIKINNTDQKNITIVAAVDPNIKQEQNTKGYAYREGNKLRYFVQFQNTGTDTAVNIIVTDTLHPNLLGRTLIFNGASHSYEYTLNNNVIKITFANINLPDTGSNKDKSIGYFDFSIDIDARINKEFKFYNQANIYFDYAAVVKTNKEYTTYTSLVKTGQTNKNLYCSYDTIKVGYSSKFSFNSGNKFKLILSDKTGSFASGTKIIDSLSSTSSTGNFKVLIPNSTSESSLYKLKVVSTNPAGTVFDDALSNNFTIIDKMKKPSFNTIDSIFCGKDSIQLKIKTAYNSFKLYDRTTLMSSKSDTVIKIPISSGYHYYAVEASYKSCVISSDTFKVYSEKLPVIKLSSPSHSNLKVCGNDSVTLEITGCKKFDLLGNSNSYISSHTSSPIKITTPANLDKRLVRGYSDKGCSDTSNTLQFIRYTKPTVTLTISDADFEICAGNNVVYTGKGATSYQLYKNDTAWLAKFTNTISSAGVKTTSKIRLEGTDNNGCKSNSNLITLNVNPLPDVKFTCTDTDLKICINYSATFGFSGATSYKLYKNNSYWLVPTSNPYTTSSFVNNDEFFIQGTSAKNCVNNSNKIKLNIIDPKVDLTLRNKGDICNIDTVFLDFSGGVSYDLFKNNTLFKTIKGQSFSSLGFSNGDVVFIEGTDSFGCIARSSSITLTLVSKPTITITNDDADNTHCAGDLVNLNLKGGAKFDLYKNNTLWLSSLGAKTNFRNINNNDEIYAIGYSNSGCNNTSNKIKFTVLALPTVTISNPDTDNSHCKGENVVINFSGGATYDLFKNNVIWKTNTGNSVTFNDAIDKDEIYSVGIGSNGCIDTSNKIKFTVWPIPNKPTITKSGTVLSSSYPTGNQWYEGTSKLAGATAQNYSPVKTATYFVEHTDANGCLSPLSDGFGYSVSISKIKLKGLKIYPNPASDYLIIETGESGKFHLSLIDITGKLVKEESFTGNRFEWQLKPAKGIYTLKIVNEKGETENVVVEFK